MRDTGELSRDDAVRATYQAHGPELYRLAWRALRDDGLAEEAVQETFVRAWRAADRYNADVASIRTWLFAIARNVVTDLARRRAVRPPLAWRDPDVELAEDDAVERAILGWQVEEALRRLTSEHRQVIVETYYGGRSRPELAARLGIPEGTVKSRLYYALRALRLALEEIGWTDDA